MNFNIPIYKAEHDVAGLADRIKANLVIGYACQVTHYEPPAIKAEAIKALLESSKAGLNDMDLFFTKSVLVSSNWNKNADVFDKVEVWTARKTPVYKRDNIGHDEKQIIGHMIDCWAMDTDGNVIPDDTVLDDLPDLYHLATSSVIYTHWEDKDTKDKVKALIEKINAGEMFVSMECLLRGFDYAVISPNGEQSIIARNQDTAFLTKHLRAYGGSGVYEDYKIGRLPRNIVFSGKGYVEKPANPNSIILASEANQSFNPKGYFNTFSKQSGVSFNTQVTAKTNTENNDMADENVTKVLEAKVADLQAALDKAVNDNKALAKQISDADVAKKDGLINELNAKLTTSEDNAKALQVKIDELQANVTASNQKVEEVTAAKTELETQLNAIKAEQLKAERVALFVAKGFNQEEAGEYVTKFANLNNEQFAALAEAIPAKAEKTASATASETVVEEVVVTPTEEPTLTVASDDIEAAKAEKQQELVSFLSKSLGKNK